MVAVAMAFWVVGMVIWNGWLLDGCLYRVLP